MKQLAILGSTGSIGRQTLDVVRKHPKLFSISAMAAGYNMPLFAEQVAEFKPGIISVASDKAYAVLKEIGIPTNITIGVGDEGLNLVATDHSAEMVVSALVGAMGLRSTVQGIKAGKNIALANKEVLVTAGTQIMKLARQYGVTILPIDSEHSALHQCLQGNSSIQSVARLILTASGGALRDHAISDLGKVKPETALAHPNWSMGRKITIDSATLMNKGLEVIEAHHLFGIGYENISVLMHPESIVHSLVEFVDGSILAQLGMPDMRVPIQYALTYPERQPNDFPRLDLASIRNLSFGAPNHKRYPCLQLAYSVGKLGGTAPTVMNAANEVAVQLFLDHQITFTHIPAIIEKALSDYPIDSNPTIEEIIALDAEVRASLAS